MKHSLNSPQTPFSFRSLFTLLTSTALTLGLFLFGCGESDKLKSKNDNNKSDISNKPTPSNTNTQALQYATTGHLLEIKRLIHRTIQPTQTQYQHPCIELNPVEGSKKKHLVLELTYQNCQFNTGKKAVPTENSEWQGAQRLTLQFGSPTTYEDFISNPKLFKSLHIELHQPNTNIPGLEVSLFDARQRLLNTIRFTRHTLTLKKRKKIPQSTAYSFEYKMSSRFKLNTQKRNQFYQHKYETQVTGRLQIDPKDLKNYQVLSFKSKTWLKIDQLEKQNTTRITRFYLVGELASMIKNKDDKSPAMDNCGIPTATYLVQYRDQLNDQQGKFKLTNDKDTISSSAQKISTKTCATLHPSAYSRFLKHLLVNWNYR